MRTCVCSGVRAAIFCSIFHQTGANISRRGLEKRRTIFQFTLRVWKSSWSLSHWLICTFLWVNVERLRTTCFCPDGMPPETSYNRPQCQCNLMVTLWWADLLSFLQKKHILIWFVLIMLMFYFTSICLSKHCEKLLKCYLLRAIASSIVPLWLNSSFNNLQQISIFRHPLSNTIIMFGLRKSNSQSIILASMELIMVALKQ